jgi:hypothetical protein
MTRSKVNKLLTAAGATRSYPTTPGAINRQLEAISAGRGLRKPTPAHPFWECMTAGPHVHWSSGRMTHGRYAGPNYARAYGEQLTCEQYRAGKPEQMST